jgi:hypothetical protein
VLKQASYHGSIQVMGNGGICPCIYNLDTAWSWVESSMPWLIFPWNRALDRPLLGYWVDPRFCMDALGTRLISFSCHEIFSRILGVNSSEYFWENNVCSLGASECAERILVWEYKVKLILNLIVKIHKFYFSVEPTEACRLFLLPASLNFGDPSSQQNFCTRNDL